MINISPFVLLIKVLQIHKSIHTSKNIIIILIFVLSKTVIIIVSALVIGRVLVKTRSIISVAIILAI